MTFPMESHSKFHGSHRTFGPIHRGKLSDPASTKGTTETLHQFRVRSNVKCLDAFMLLFEWNQMIMLFAGVLLYWMHMFSSWDVKLRIPHTSIICSYVLWQQTENMLTIYQIFYQVHTCKLNYYLCFPINPIIYSPHIQHILNIVQSLVC